MFFHGLGNLLKFFHLNDGMKNHDVANTIVAWTGWVMMITGQSMVLYSRLHLLVQARWARWILAVIIIDGVVLHTSTGVLTFLTNLDGARRWTVPYTIVERIQVRQSGSIDCNTMLNYTGLHLLRSGGRPFWYLHLEDHRYAQI